MILLQGADACDHVIILAGGKGTRLGELTKNTPKPMVLVNGEPFLYWQIRNLIQQGLQSFTLLTAHLECSIRNYPWEDRFPGSTIDFVSDYKVEGTGGSVYRFFEMRKGVSAALLLNGDTYVDAQLPSIVEQSADAWYFPFSAGTIPDSSSNLLGENGTLLSLRENGTGNLFDSGIIALSRRAILSHNSTFPCTINDLLDEAVKRGRISYSLIEGTCYDIGTSTRLARFEKFIEERS